MFCHISDPDSFRTILHHAELCFSGCEVAFFQLLMLVVRILALAACVLSRS
jgi:hypothetical protein